MTDNEIIKALNICRKGKCSECPRIANDKCIAQVSENALDLINRQKAEIERLEKDSKRLKKVQMQLDDAMKMYTTIKSEAVKEYERLLSNELSCLLDCTYGSKWSLYKVADVRDAIKKVSAEMVGADNGNTEKNN